MEDMEESFGPETPLAKRKLSSKRAKERLQGIRHKKRKIKIIREAKLIAELEAAQKAKDSSPAPTNGASPLPAESADPAAPEKPAKKPKDPKRLKEKRKLKELRKKLKEKKERRKSGGEDEEKPKRKRSKVQEEESREEESPPVQRRVSIALPGSILSNAQSPELRTYLAGQVARAAAVFRVEEIVIFDEAAQLTDKQIARFEESGLEFVEGETPEPNLFMAALLQYVETPQYLRKYLFPLNRHFRLVGLLNPLDAPHHMRGDDVSCPYREAVSLSRPGKESGTLCYAGIQKEISIEETLEPNVRLTLRIDDYYAGRRRLSGVAVSPREPVTEAGHYWGYSVRLASSLSQALVPGSGEAYDAVVGTSERGDPVNAFRFPKDAERVLVVFGGVAGLEAAAEADEDLQTSSLRDVFPKALLNTCPGQGSRTIRTEEAVLITLAALRL